MGDLFDELKEKMKDKMPNDSSKTMGFPDFSMQGMKEGKWVFIVSLNSHSLYAM